MNDIQELLDQLRGQKWTDAAIAEELGTYRETVAVWRRGQSYPRYAKAIKIALRSLMLREPPKGRRYSKEAVDTWQREGRYSESRVKGSGNDGRDKEGA